MWSKAAYQARLRGKKQTFSRSGPYFQIIHLRKETSREDLRALQYSWKLWWGTESSDHSVDQGDVDNDNGLIWLSDLDTGTIED